MGWYGWPTGKSCTCTGQTDCSVYSDDFNRADGAPGADWSVVSGDVTIKDNELALDMSINTTSAHVTHVASGRGTGGIYTNFTFRFTNDTDVLFVDVNFTTGSERTYRITSRTFKVYDGPGGSLVYRTSFRRPLNVGVNHPIGFCVDDANESITIALALHNFVYEDSHTNGGLDYFEFRTDTINTTTVVPPPSPYTETVFIDSFDQLDTDENDANCSPCGGWRESHGCFGGPDFDAPCPTEVILDLGTVSLTDDGCSECTNIGGEYNLRMPYGSCCLKQGNEPIRPGWTYCEKLPCDSAKFPTYEAVGIKIFLRYLRVFFPEEAWYWLAEIGLSDAFFVPPKDESWLECDCGIAGLPCAYGGLKPSRWAVARYILKTTSEPPFCDDRANVTLSKGAIPNSFNPNWTCDAINEGTWTDDPCGGWSDANWPDTITVKQVT